MELVLQLLLAALVSSFLFPEGTKELLGTFLSVVVLKLRTFSIEDGMEAVDWKGGRVSVTGSERWAVVRKNAELELKVLTEVELSNPHYHQLLGEALYYHPEKVREWCSKNGHAYKDPSKL